ncbi:uncharacterized protein LOC109046293 isoform X2 [Cyprinus carpio]|uniref:Uncharacterized protein LOC109046293 isoform X2 n=1 Tax=Cyprinus carpio TaxID=7962 RepID=A0A9Q9ZA71_CYPCA|nr:uncharacterized protein LOC109046293 isoform X2 [Cyprinus carpio]
MSSANPQTGLCGMFSCTLYEFPSTTDALSHIFRAQLSVPRQEYFYGILCKKDFELNLAVVLMVLAGILILALLYWVLLLRHRLRVAQAGNALEYFGFYHMAQYDLKEPNLPVVTPSLPSPPPPVPQPPVHVTPPPPHMLYASAPIIHTTPPSPHPSCGASSDAEVYSRIGVLRPSRLSSVSQTQVILFEHSAL